MKQKIDIELKKLSDSISEKLKSIESLLDYHEIKESAKIKFPRGYLRTVKDHKSKSPDHFSEGLKSDLAYTLMFCDVVRWLGTRTDLWGAPFGMCVKFSIVALASVMESVLEKIEPSKGKKIDGERVGLVKARIYKLERKQTINSDLRERLNHLWDLRNGIHIPGIDYNKPIGDHNYGRQDYNNARKSLFDLLHQIKNNL